MTMQTMIPMAILALGAAAMAWLAAQGAFHPVAAFAWAFDVRQSPFLPLFAASWAAAAACAYAQRRRACGGGSAR